MSDVTAVLAEIDANRAPHLQRLMDYLRQPSISAEGVGIAETAAFLAAELTRIGLRAELAPSSGSPMVFAEWSGAPGRPTILLYGHYDVQPAGDPAAWLSPPFEPTIRDGRLYARGAGDNKGQHFAHLLALEATLTQTGRLPCNVKVLLEGEEEMGSPSLSAFVRDHRAELAADLVVTSDGPQDIGGSPVLQFGARGVISFELRAHGANRDLHSGNWGGVAPNPIWTLVHLLATMKNAAGEITIDGLHDDILPLTAAEQAVQDAMPLDLPAVMASLGIDHLDAPPARGFFDRLTTWPTLTINGLHGGYGGVGSMTVLPHEAVAKCDVRLVEAQSAADVYAKIVAHVRRHAPEVEIVHQGAMDPSRTPVDSRFTEPILRAIKLGQGRAPVRLLAMGGSLPDYVFTKTLGVPAFTIPYANADEANHAPNENIEVELFLRGIRTTAALLDAIGEMEGPA